MKRNKIPKILLAACLVILLAGAVYFGKSIWEDAAPLLASEGYYKSLRKEIYIQRENGQTPDMEKLNGLNQDGVAWLTSPGTTIDYPVVQGKDNEYYLHHLSDGTPNEIGAVFLDYQNNPDFTGEISMIYGHHITLGRMFSPLSSYKEQRYYEEHPRMILYTKEKTYHIELFAGNILSGSEGFPLSFQSGKDKKEWIQEIIRKSTFSSNITPAKNDRILILCTCSYEFSNARYAVFGKLTEVK
ncbi:MAG: hypothetical protein RHS_3475 [Robinsoniella sp. RHS]|uniref:class B sortase n=1 Tax=Robinsoniella sp. RHS TaxID=1504536 RepID=UPI000658AD9A|nr:MAG: hypothetical protein RHS_3475 [Robinsoniella sp. RHS]